MTCRRYYERNRSRFRASDRYEARHILLACAPDDLTARDAAKERATRIIAVLQHDPGLFGTLAIAYSACPARNRGGSLGRCERGDTVSELETYILSLSEGELCPLPVESRSGVHVVALDWKAVGEALAFEAVRDQISAYLSNVAFQTAIRHYLMQLAAQARIEGFTMPAAETPLLQEEAS